MLITSRPHACNARIAASLPEPGPFTNTSTVFKPWIKAAFVAVSAAICAAYGVDFLEPLKPRPPALAQLSALPSASVRVTIVLLKDDWICACPRSTFFLIRFFVTFFVTLAISKLTYFLLLSNRQLLSVISSYLPRSSSGLFWFLRWSLSSDREPADSYDDERPCSIRSPAVS